MPRSFLVKKKTKGKDERSPSCDAGGQVVSLVDAVVEDMQSQQQETTPTTAGTTVVTALQNSPAEYVTHGVQQRELHTSTAVQLLSIPG